jgi:hypothetical protein
LPISHARENDVIQPNSHANITLFQEALEKRRDKRKYASITEKYSLRSEI